MASTKFIKGNELMLFDEKGKSYAYATNHTLTLTAETSDVSSKDHGLWSSAEVSKFSWEIQTENIFTESNFADFFDKWSTGASMTVIFGLKKESDNTKTVADGDYTNWSVALSSTSGSEQYYYTGKVVITSLTANANNGENATYSCTLTGVGKFVKSNTAITA